MVVKEIKANYHSYLSEIKTVLDPVINKMRTQAGQSWKGKAWIGPIKQWGSYLKHLKVLKAIQWSTLPIIGPTIAAFLAGKYGQVPIWICAVGGLLAALGAYYILVSRCENKMATIGDPNFHVEAFKIKRPTEYQVWAQFVHKTDFTFEGLYDLVNSVFSQGNSDIAYFVSYSQSQHDFMQKSIEELQTTIEEQKEAISGLEMDLVQSENAVSYLVEIIKKTNQNLYRFVNHRLDFTDLDFISGFSLYRKVGSRLEVILDKGTTGKIKSLNLDEDTSYAAVIAAKDDLEQAHHSIPYPGRHLVAFRMQMLQDELWVWCFHFDHDDDRALSLILGNGIIETRQIRRLIHAFCLSIQQRLISLREVDTNAEAN